MSAPILTFFNNKGGVGKTSLVYHLAWMFASLGKKVVVTDLDPQANLTAAFLTEDQIEPLWNDQKSGSTLYHCVKPLTELKEIVEPQLQKIADNLYLIPGDVELSNFEDTLSKEWPSSMGDNNLYGPMRILSSFWQVMQIAAKKIDADMILVDISPNLAAINRSVLLGSDFVAIPLGADLFSLQGLKNLGPTLKRWKKQWKKRLDNWNDSNDKNSNPNLKLPKGKMKPIGYLCQQHSICLERPIKAYDRWVQKIPRVYRESILNEKNGNDVTVTQQNDPHCLATIKHYRSLIPMAQEHRKPIFKLTSADGAIGSHVNAVTAARYDFEKLARAIAEKINITV